MMDLVSQYYQNPVHRGALESYDISRYEGNSICGDNVTVYIQLKKKNNSIYIVNWSYDGDASMITTAGASFFGDLVLDMSIDQVLTMTYGDLLREGFEVSHRRKRGASIAILATRNAIHIYLGDGLLDTRDDVIIDC